MERAALSPRYTDYAIPAAVSALRGLTDYTAYEEVAIEFLHHKDRPIAENIGIANSVTIINPNKRWFISGDDKGLIDLVYLGFLLFGTSVQSIYLMVGLLCLGSIVLYIIEFRQSGPKMALLVATLTGLFAILFTFGITNQSSSIIEPRFLGFIGIVPFLHVTLIVVASRRLAFWSLVRATAQIAIIMFVVHLRGSEIWQLLCVLAACLLSILILRKLSRIAVAITAIVLILGAGLVAYREFMYNPYYLNSDVSSRVFWHNAVMGLAANPAIGQRFQIQVLRDRSVTQAIRRYLADTNQDDMRNAIFADKNYAGGNFQNFKWSLYEPAARDFYFFIAREMPFEILKTYIEFMPKIFVANISYMMGHAALERDLDSVGTLETPTQRRLHDHYLKPLRAIPIILTLLAGILLAASAAIYDKSAVISIVTAIIGSMVPPLLVMPVIQYIQLTTALILAGAFFAAIMTLAALLRPACELVGLRFFGGHSEAASAARPELPETFEEIK